MSPGAKRRKLRGPEYHQLESMASVGASIETMAKRLGFSSRTLRRIIERDERAKEAFDTGRGQMESELVGILYHQAVNPKNRNPTPAIFLLKSMRGFSDQPLPRVDESRVRVEVRLPAALTEEQYGKLVDVGPKMKLLKAETKSSV